MRSFIKWAGGKRQLLSEITDIIDSMRVDCDEFIYVEPFVGGGAVLFELLEKCSNLKYAIINDMNKGLMCCYRAIQDESMYPKLKEKLDSLSNEYNNSDDKRAYYESKRNEYNMQLKKDCTNTIETAALLMFINKTSFNGLYRENSKGEFNVPWNKAEYVTLYNEDNLNMIHILLNEKVIILNNDYKCVKFAEDLARIENCNLIYYLDPPYRPISETSSFVNYTKSGFNDKDQNELKQFCDYIDSKGRYFLLSNNKSDDFFENLYEEYTIKTVGSRRSINSVSSKRGEVDELLIYNHIENQTGLF